MEYVTVATISFGLLLIVIKIASPTISPIAGNLVFTTIAALLQMGVLAFYKINKMPLMVLKKGLILSASGGVLLGIYTVSLFLSLTHMPISKVAPIVYSGGIVIAVCFGVIFLGESVVWQKGIGIFLVVLGIALTFGYS